MTIALIGNVTEPKTKKSTMNADEADHDRCAHPNRVLQIVEHRRDAADLHDHAGRHAQAAQGRDLIDADVFVEDLRRHHTDAYPLALADAVEQHLHRAVFLGARTQQHL